MTRRVTRERAIVPAVIALLFGLLLSVAYPAAQPAAEGVFADPAGRYTVPIPTNWRAEVNADYATLFAPGDLIRVHFVVVETDDVEQAIKDAWVLTDPDFALDPSEVIDLPPAMFGGVDQATLVAYETEADEPIIQAEAFRLGGTVFVLLYVGDRVAIDQRIAQLQIIESGFQIAAIEGQNIAGIEPRPLDAALVAELEAFIAETLAAFEVPGAAVAVVQNGETVYARGFGVRDVTSGVAVTPETLMMIGSSTKSMTTMLMAQLVDQGVYGWDTRAVDIFPDFRVADPAVTPLLTMRNLVCACTGVPRRDAEWVLNGAKLTAEDIIASLAGFEFSTALGEAFQYSNQMVAAAGYLSALATGGRYGNLLADFTKLFEERLLAPMGMNRSTFDFTEVRASDNFATPYSYLLTGELVEVPFMTEGVLTPVAPAGGLWSSVTDMARYLATGLSLGVAPDGRRIVSEENLLVTWEPQVAITADASYGLGWIIEDYHGRQILSHAGNTFGFTSEMALMPGAGLGIIVLSNQQYSSFNSAVRERLFELVFGLESTVDDMIAFQLALAAEAEASLQGDLRPIDPAVIADHLGTFTNEALGDIVLTYADGVLRFDAGEVQGEILALDDDDSGIAYVTSAPALSGVTVRFEREGDRPVIVVSVGTSDYLLEKVAPA